MGRTGCCQKCQTIYRVDAAGAVLWHRDFYFDSPFAILYFQPPVQQCDVDANGNVYQAGSSTQPVAVSVDDQLPMYVLRSWDASGNLRWSWSDNPNGTAYAGPRAVPARLRSCRCGFDGETSIVVVGDDWTVTADHHVHATGLTCDDATQLWRVTLEAGVTLQGCGASRSLWRRNTQSTYNAIVSGAGWLVLDNSDGSTTVTQPDSVVHITFDAGTHTTWNVCAAIDADDVVFGVQGHSLFYSGGINEVFYSICKFPKDASNPTIRVKSKMFYHHASLTFFPECAGTLGIPRNVVITADVVYVFSGLGVEWFDKTTLASVGHTCFHNANAWFVDVVDDRAGFQIQTGNVHFPPSVCLADFSTWKVWVESPDPFAGLGLGPGVASPYFDARIHPAGGSIWSQGRECNPHTLTDDARTIDTTCPELCCDVCFEMDFPTSITGFGWTGDVDTGHSVGTFSWNPPDDRLNVLLQVNPGRCGDLCQWESGVLSIFGGSSYHARLEWDRTGTAATLTVSAGYYVTLSGGATSNPPYVVTVWECGDFSCDGGTFTRTAPADEADVDPSIPSTLNLTVTDCSGKDAGVNVCAGTTDYISIADGAGGFLWIQDGPDLCAPGDCAPQEPVTTPTAAGQYTSTNCA